MKRLMFAALAVLFIAQALALGPLYLAMFVAIIVGSVARLVWRVINPR